MGFPKAHLQGRALFLRICVGKLDLTVGCIYVPPQSTTGAMSMVTEQIYDYMDTIMKHTPSRSWPIIGGDFNGKTGKERSGRLIESDSVGRCGAEIENSQGRMMRQFCERTGLIVANTYKGCEKTYWSMTGQATSRIDYLLLPTRWREKYEVKVMKRLGHAIQAATKTMMQIDHVPIKFEVQDIMMFEEGEDSAQGWSQNEMIDCWVSGKGREKILNDMITKMNEKEEMFAEIEQNHNATRTYQEIHNVLREVAQDHLWKANTKKMQNEELKGYKKQKMQSINERNQQRRQLTMIWPKMEAMKMACRNSVQRQDIDELQQKMILKATMRFWKEQQKLEKTTKAVMMINRQSKAARDNYFV